MQSWHLWCFVFLLETGISALMGNGNEMDDPLHESNQSANLDASVFSFSEQAAQPYAVLRDQLHQHTTALILAEMREDSVGIQEALAGLTKGLQAILDRACHPASPEPSRELERAARELAVHLDRIGYIRDSGEMQDYRMEVGKTTARITQFDAVLKSVAGDSASTRPKERISRDSSESEK